MLEGGQCLFPHRDGKGVKLHQRVYGAAADRGTDRGKATAADGNKGNGTKTKADAKVKAAAKKGIADPHK